mmetsp:Transcript_9630/g.19250  ORF Transcript_9630/g.19250 Transcript_9630/m.19250 type:complete len:203 (+) Transcript_9630:1556-2164(+)
MDGWTRFDPTQRRNSLANFSPERARELPRFTQFFLSGLIPFDCLCWLISLSRSESAVISLDSAPVLRFKHLAVSATDKLFATRRSTRTWMPLGYSRCFCPKRLPLALEGRMAASCSGTWKSAVSMSVSLLTLRAILLRSRFSAFFLFSCWLRCSVALATVPVGLWITRTAESTLFLCWPPGPEARKVSMSHCCHSFSSSRAK